MLLALIGAIIIGLSLGLLGSGGSILTVPILVYVLGQPEKVAIAGSLIIVGSIALAGAIPWALRRQVDWRSVLLFGLPGMLGTWFGATLAAYLPGPLQLAIFAVVMLIAATRMLQPAAVAEVAPARRSRLVMQGLGVGVLTGIVGVGGGFLILPALVVLGGLSMHRAIGTSLSIISINAFSGFAKHYLGWDRVPRFDGKGDDGADGDEFKAAQQLDSIAEVEFWVRNVARHADAFWLPLAGGRTYPDFVAKLKDGRLLVVEYKGDHLVADSNEKRAIGQLWQEASNGKGIYVFAEKERDGMSVKQQIASAIG